TVALAYKRDLNGARLRRRSWYGCWRWYRRRCWRWCRGRRDECGCRLPLGIGVVGRVVRQVRQSASVRAHNIDFVVAVAVRHESDAVACSRPSRAVVAAGYVRGDHLLACAIGIPHLELEAGGT